MKKFLAALLLAMASVATAAPVSAANPNKFQAKQGNTTLTLNVPNAQCSNAVSEMRTSGMRRFQLAKCNANSGFIQFPESGGDITTAWLYPTPPPACIPPTLPPPVTQPGVCPAGTAGNWTQTATFTAANPQVPPNGCWVQGPFLPTSPPAGACVSTAPPPQTRPQTCPAGTTGTWTQTNNWSWNGTTWVENWQPTSPPAGACTPTGGGGMVPAIDVTHDPMASKPARGTIITTPHYDTTYNRITDHTADVPGVSMLRNDYSRRQPVNANGTRLIVGFNDEYWYAYDITDPVHAHFIELLNGPVGDSEIQWDPTDPDVYYYIAINGGTELFKGHVSTNTHESFYNFASAVQAFWPTARRCWTKSEGSPSADNRYWGLMCETDGFSPLGFVVLDTQAKSVVWHMNNSVRPDHVSMSPTGRWFEVSGDDPRGTIAYGIAPDVLGQTRQLHHKSEHSDLGSCNGHDFYASIDYQTNQGDIFWTDLEDASVTRHVVGYIYGHPNPWFGTNYAIHVSAKSFGKCGFLTSNYGVPPNNIVWWDFNAPANTPYGVGMSYSVDNNYFDEIQAAMGRDGTQFFYNDNFGSSLTGDVYRGTMPH